MKVGASITIDKRVISGTVSLHREEGESDFLGGLITGTLGNLIEEDEIEDIIDDEDEALGDEDDEEDEGNIEIEHF